MLVAVFFSVLLGVGSVLPTLLYAAATAVAKGTGTIHKEIPYQGVVNGDRRRSLDLYLPGDRGAKVPLLIFIHGGFWELTDDDYRIGPALAANLVKYDVAVALVRYRLAPAYRHPIQAEDVTAGVADLIKMADVYGYDRHHIFLSGHSAGAHLAALVALDRRYFARRQLNTTSLAGVIAVSGLYDLAPHHDVSVQQRLATQHAFGSEAALVESASPIRYVDLNAPPFLILTAAQDFQGFAEDATKFADALRRTGNKKVQHETIRGTDHFSIIRFDGEKNPVRRTVFAFMRKSS